MSSLRIGTAIVLLLAFAISTPGFSQQPDDPAASIQADLQVVLDKSADIESRLAAIERVLDQVARTDGLISDEGIGVLHLEAGILYAQRPSGNRADNIEKAIAAYDAALSVFTKEAFPEDWARTQGSLAMAYDDRIRGSRADNIETAIAAYEATLSVFTKETFPQHWAAIQNVLAGAYSDRIHGSRADNLEKTIAAYEAALSVFTKDAFPEDRARTQNTLAGAYVLRIRGSRADNIEMAITHSEAALSVFTKDAFPQDWAQTQNNLAGAYIHRIHGSRADNLEKAITASEAALSVRTKNAFPQDWGHSQNNLGVIYTERIRGSRADNLEKAIAVYEAALSVRTKDAFPQDWAITQNNLAAAYSNRIHGSRADNLEMAIAAYEAALSVHTKEAFPQDWAQIQNNLGVVYTDRIRGSRADNTEKAIAALGAALIVLTKEAFPEDWAGTEYNLAFAYSNHIRGSPEKAITHSEAALSVFTKEAFPQDWAATQNVLAGAYIDRIRGSRAANIEKAIAAYGAALSVLTKDAFPQRWAMIQGNLANAYRNRIHGSRADNLERAITRFEAALSVHTKDAFPRGHLRISRLLGDAFTEAARASTDERWSDADRAYAEAIETVRLLVGQGLNETDTLDVMSSARTLFSNAAFVALRRNESARALRIVEEGRGRLLNLALQLEALPLSDEERAKLRDLRKRVTILERELQDPGPQSRRDATLAELAESRRAILEIVNRAEGRNDTQTGAGWTRLAPPPGGAFVIPVFSDFGGAFLILTRPLAEAIPRFEDLPYLTTERLNTIFFGAEQDEPGGWMAGYAINYLPRDMQVEVRDLWHARIEAIGDYLWPLLGAPLVQALEQAGVSEGARIVLLPQGLLGALPLWLIRDPETGRTLIDRYEIATAPSLAALGRIMTRSPRRNADRSLAGLIGPTDDLPFTLAEGAMVARWFDVDTRHMLGSAKATSVDAVLGALRGRSYWHLSTHARFDWNDARNSGLMLAGGARLTVGDLLSTSGLGQPELVTLSACETGLYDLKSPGEFIGLPAAFIQAGARGVIASLWPVSDASTALLMARFYDYHIGEEGLPAVTALRAAQLWLRDVTRAQLRDYLTEKVRAYGDPRVADARRIASLKVRFEGGEDEERPFTHPYHWGAFYFTGADAAPSQP